MKVAHRCQHPQPACVRMRGSTSGDRRPTLERPDRAGLLPAPRSTTLGQANFIGSVWMRASS